jgi:hypothetical protein
MDRYNMDYLLQEAEVLAAATSKDRPPQLNPAVSGNRCGCACDTQRGEDDGGGGSSDVEGGYLR